MLCGVKKGRETLEETNEAFQLCAFMTNTFQSSPCFRLESSKGYVLIRGIY